MFLTDSAGQAEKENKRLKRMEISIQRLTVEAQAHGMPLIYNQKSMNL